MSVSVSDHVVPIARRSATAAWEWRTAIAEWERWARLYKRYPETTIRTRRDHLQLLAKSVSTGPWDLTEAELLTWFEGRDWATNTYLSRRTTMRHFFGAWAVEHAEKITRSPARGIPSIPPPPPNPMPAPDRVYDAALHAADPRLRLMLLLAAGHGLRRGEVAVVRPERDLVEDLQGWSLIVHGKGGKDRLVPLEDETAALLRKAPAGYLFPSRNDPETPLTARHVGKLVARALEGTWTMHKLRHRAATYFAEDADHDMRVVQDLLGHSNLNTTMLYVPANRDRMRQAVNGRRSSTDAVRERRVTGRGGGTSA